MQRTILAVAMLGLFAGSANAGTIADAQVAYWNFDSYTAGSNPGGFPGGTNQGSFADQWGSHTAYAGRPDNAATSPLDASGGRFGGAFYSNGDGSGAIAAVAHTTALDFAVGTSFTVSAWEKVEYRSPTGSKGWLGGQTRSPVWTKAEDIDSPTGLGLKYNSDNFGPAYDNGDAYGQHYYKSVPHQQWDNNQWAHYVLVGEFVSGDDVDLKTFINGAHITGLDVTVSASQISNSGYLSFGAYWRDGDRPGQHELAWHADGSDADGVGQGWVDDVAMIDLALSDPEVVAIYNLAEYDELGYAAGDVVQLLDVHRSAAGTATTSDGKIWGYDPTLSGTPGVVQDLGGGIYGVVLDASGTGGVTVVPEPTSLALLLGLGGLLLCRRRRK